MGRYYQLLYGYAKARRNIATRREAIKRFGEMGKIGGEDNRANEKAIIAANYLTGKFSQEELAKHNISLGAANKITRFTTPENER